MALVRTFLAAWLAIVVALVPAAGGATVVTKAATILMPDRSAMPCCDHMDRCGDAATCALKCLNFVAPALTIYAMPTFHVHARAWTEMPALHGQILPPPTHPPQA
jgi:hypothetical protein